MRRLPPLDSSQNGVCREEDTGELIGRAGSGKKSLQEDVLQQAMEGEKKRKEKRRENALLLQWSVANELGMSCNG